MLTTNSSKLTRSWPLVVVLIALTMIVAVVKIGQFSVPLEEISAVSTGVTTKDDTTHCHWRTVFTSAGKLKQPKLLKQAIAKGLPVRVIDAKYHEMECTTTSATEILPNGHVAVHCETDAAWANGVTTLGKQYRYFFRIDTQGLVHYVKTLISSTKPLETGHFSSTVSFLVPTTACGWKAGFIVQKKKVISGSIKELRHAVLSGHSVMAKISSLGSLSPSWFRFHKKTKYGWMTLTRPIVLVTENKKIVQEDSTNGVLNEEIEDSDEDEEQNLIEKQVVKKKKKKIEFHFESFWITTSGHVYYKKTTWDGKVVAQKASFEHVEIWHGLLK